VVGRVGGVKEQDLVARVEQHDPGGFASEGERTHGVARYRLVLLTWRCTREGVTTVIEGDEVMNRLGRSCPSWAAHHPVAAAAPLDGPRDYEPVAAFVHHLVDLGEQGRTDEFPAVFDAIEEILTDGDGDAVSLARTGFVEDLQNVVSHRDVALDADSFSSYLGPRTADVWAELDAAWTAAADAPDAGEHRPAAEEFLALAPTERRRIQSMTRELPDGTLAAPSDVLRYEANQYDEELTRWLRVMRMSPLVWFVLLVFAGLAVWVLVRG
jgi:hypothetical protein